MINEGLELDLLPPLPDLEELRHSSSPGAVSQVAWRELTNDEFQAVLDGKVPLEGNRGLSVPVPPATAALAVEAVFTSQNPAGNTDGNPEPGEIPSQLPQETLERYVEAAALRYTFRIDTLTPTDLAGLPPLYSDLKSAEREALFGFLTPRCEIVADQRGQTRWLLRDAERRAALIRLLSHPQTWIEQAVQQARDGATREALSEPPSPDKASEAPQGPAPIEEMLWNCVLNTPPAMDRLSRAELLLLRRVVEWLANTRLSKMKLPALASVDRVLARETLLQPFRHLTGEWSKQGFTSHFAGREEELSRLYDFLSLKPPDSLAAWLRRSLHHAQIAWGRVTGKTGNDRLLIYGPGGVGKSTLLAKFLLDHLTDGKKEPFPYAYLDFDLSVLSPREPLTLLTEAARQLGTQYLESQEKWNAFHARWLAECQRGKDGDAVSAVQRQEALREFQDLLNASVSDTGKRVSQIFSQGLPFLLVLDTFEEAQYQGRDEVRDTFRFLDGLRDALPQTRVVLMGRAPLDEVQHATAIEEAAVIEGDAFGTGVATDFNVIEVPLGDLHQSAAIQYLRGQGIHNDQLAEELVTALGGNPLTLRLIARILKEGDLDISSLRAEMQWKPGITDRLRGRTIPPKAILQGVLFKRFLGHIHDKSVYDLAHPGLAVRRITPEIIREVLAEPCGLTPLAEGREYELFYSLEREVALVSLSRESSGEVVVRHRPELRQIMLHLMDADVEKADQIRRVHENAIRYYEARKDVISRQEALYHRLMLGNPPYPEKYADDVPTEEAIEAGYVRAPVGNNDPRPVWRGLASSVGELPPPAVAYLDARLHRSLMQNASWEEANLRDWEVEILSRTSQRVRKRAHIGSALEALRHDRASLFARSQNEGASPSTSVLTLLEITLLERWEKYGPALDLARAAKASIESNEERRYFEYSLLEARLQARLRNDDACCSALADAANFLIRRRQIEQSTTNLRRLEAQHLRFVADCVQLMPGPRVWDLAAELLVHGDFSLFRQRPVLSRYGVASVLAHINESMLDLPRYRALVHFTKNPDVLGLLLYRPSPATIVRLSEELAQWTIRVLSRMEQAYVKLEIDPLFRSLERMALEKEWRSQFERRLREPDWEWFSSFLQTAPVTDADWVLICKAFLLREKPTETSLREDAFKEARRAGEMLPGESPGKIFEVFPI